MPVSIHQLVKSVQPPFGFSRVVQLAVAEDSQIRLTNLRLLLASRGLSVAGASRQFGRSVSFWSDMLNGRKSFGERLARRIEEQAQLPRGALDRPLARDELPTPDVLVASEPPGPWGASPQSRSRSLSLEAFLTQLAAMPRSRGMAVSAALSQVCGHPERLEETWETLDALVSSDLLSGRRLP